MIRTNRQQLSRRLDRGSADQPWLHDERPHGSGILKTVEAMDAEDQLLLPAAAARFQGKSRAHDVL